MITKVNVRVSGQERRFDVRFASNRTRNYINKIPSTVKNFIEHTAYKAEKVIEYGKEVTYFTYEA